MIPKTSTLTTFLTLGSLAHAAVTTMNPIPQKAKAADTVRKLIIGGPELVQTADFDGSSFTITSKNDTAGAAASWLRYKPGTNLLYGVNENGVNLNLFTLDDQKENPTYVTETVGSSGVVFLEFDKTGNHMLGAAYGAGTVDVWDVSAKDGTPKLLKTLVVGGPLGPAQTIHHPHQALLEPSGRFMLVNDLGGDQVVVIDTQDAKFDIVNNITVPSGYGPRHGGFITPSDSNATYYALACELSSKLLLFKLDYSDTTTLGMTKISEQDTFGTFPPATPDTAAAGELQVASNNADVYVSNRLSGNATDNIAHFRFDFCGDDDAMLDFVDMVSSYGVLPRMFSLSLDESILFVANQDGDSGLVALKRDANNGTVLAGPLASVANSDLVPPGLTGQKQVGPEFIQEI